MLATADLLEAFAQLNMCMEEDFVSATDNELHLLCSSTYSACSIAVKCCNPSLGNEMFTCIIRQTNLPFNFCACPPAHEVIWEGSRAAADAVLPGLQNPGKSSRLAAFLGARGVCARHLLRGLPAEPSANGPAGGTKTSQQTTPFPPPV